VILSLQTLSGRSRWIEKNGSSHPMPIDIASAALASGCHAAAHNPYKRQLNPRSCIVPPKGLSIQFFILSAMLDCATGRTVSFNFYV
jgi:hypothetical protein